MMRRIRAGLALLLVVLAQPALSQATVQYIHTDALGSVVAVSDANRNVIDRREFAPYGDQLNAPAADRGPGYTGHVEDGLTGLTYMQQRYYDPAIGRFLSVDPVGPLSDPLQHFGRYHYAVNNPYSYRDPDGREVESIGLNRIVWKQTEKTAIQVQRPTPGSRATVSSGWRSPDKATRVLFTAAVAGSVAYTTRQLKLPDKPSIAMGIAVAQGDVQLEVRNVYETEEVAAWYGTVTMNWRGDVISEETTGTGEPNRVIRKVQEQFRVMREGRELFRFDPDDPLL